MKRKTECRHQDILSLLNQHHSVKVSFLAEALQTSAVTIRKDLNILADKGLLLRQTGGAKKASHRIDYNNARNKIAQCAAQKIHDGCRVVIDSGRTTSMVVPHLQDKKNLMIMTNSLDISNQVIHLKSDTKLLMTGGTFDTNSNSFQGSVAEQALQTYDFDILLIGADGFNAEKGTTTLNELLGLSRVMAQVSRQVIVMAESNKLDRKMHNIELSWDCVDTLITDDGLSEETAKNIEQANVEVVIAHL